MTAPAARSTSCPSSDRSRPWDAAPVAGPAVGTGSARPSVPGAALRAGDVSKRRPSGRRCLMAELPPGDP